MNDIERKLSVVVSWAVHSKFQPKHIDLHAEERRFADNHHAPVSGMKRDGL